MQQEIITTVIGRDALRAELVFLTASLPAWGISECSVLFGFAWGNEYYPGNTWDYIRLPAEAVQGEVERVEAIGSGSLGDDDLFVFLPEFGTEFRFCHEEDLHLSYDAPSDLSVFFLRRWSDKGFGPQVRETTAGPVLASEETRVELG